MGALAEFEAYVAGLKPAQKAEFDELLKEQLKAVWLPDPENRPQMDAYYSKADVLLYGGAAGAGKSALLVGLAATAHQRSVIFRRKSVDLRGVEEYLLEVMGREGWNGQDNLMRRKGKIIELGHLDAPKSEEAWQGRAHDFIGFDEGAQLQRAKVQFVMGWLRSTNPKQRRRVVIASNPPTTGDGEWMMEWFAPWLDPLFPNKAKFGELRWAVTAPDRDGTTVWVPNSDPIVFTDGRNYRLATPAEIAANDRNVIVPMTRSFIPGKLDDNRYLRDTGYRAQLQALPEPLRSQMLHGDFLAGRQDHEWQIIPTEWAKAAQARWTERPPEDAIMSAIGVDVAQGGCFDDQTEILTNGGWKPFEALTGTESVLTLNALTAEWGAITQLHKYWLAGPLNVLERADLSFAITDNHQLFARGPKAETFKVRRYDALPNDFVIPRAIEWIGSNPAEMRFESRVPMHHGGVRIKEWKFSFEDWARFLGWFVSEGCAFREKSHNGRWRVNISQNKGAKYDRIAALLDRMGIKALHQGSRSTLEFSINSIGAHLADHCGVHAANKRIPEYIRNAKPEIIRAFLEEYRLGDGSVNGSGVTVYSTTSKCLADDLQEVLAKLGRAGKMTTRHEKGSSFIIGNRMVVRKNTEFTVTERKVAADCFIQKKNVQRLAYEGFVYCVSTPLKTILVRRKGTVMWSGNSDETVLAPRHGPWYAPLIVKPGAETPKPSHVAGLVVTTRRNACAVVIDVGGGYGGGAVERLEENEIKVRPFNGAGESWERTADKQLTFINRRAEAHWRFREALDPDQPGGSKIALPPDPQLIAELTAIRWKMASGGIQVEAKDDPSPKGLKARLGGRSPNRSDAVIMAWSEGEKAIIAGIRRREREARKVSEKLPSFKTGLTPFNRGTGWMQK